MTEDRYELFISYSRKDDTGGWVTGLRDVILADHRRFSSEPMRIFFDRDAIADMDDWRHRILRGLQSSSLLLVCLSPNYFASQYCRWEFDEYLRTQARVQVGGEGIAPVYFVELPDADPAVDARWRAEVAERHNFTDLREWFPLGVGAIQDGEVVARLAKLGEQVWDRLGRVRRAESVRGNVRRPSPTFVGRHSETRRLHNELTTGQVGVVTTLHGLGGMGKTELAVAYAHAFRDHYRGGAWSLTAEGKSDLLALVGELAFVPELGLRPTQEQRMDSHLLGRAVLSHLEQLAVEEPTDDAWGGSGRAALLILDNVDDPGLLSARQLADLPGGDVLRVVATTRMSGEQLTARASLAFVAVDALDPGDALELLRSHQPARDDDGLRPDFTDTEQEHAAAQIVELLAGYTLAVEQVAVYLGLNPQVTPQALLSGLQVKGVGLADDVAGDSVRAAMRHQSGLLEQVLESSLGLLDEPGRYALLVAACLPPDTIPWPWLAELTTAQFPELADHAEWEPDPWGDVRRRLEGLRLLTPGESPQTARMHRVITAAVRDANPEPAHAAAAAVTDLLCQWADRASDKWARTGAIPEVWQTDTALAALSVALAGPQQARVARAFAFLGAMVLATKGLAPAVEIAEGTQAILRRLAAGDPGNAQAARDVSVSLNNIGRVAMRAGDLAAARDAYTEMHETLRRLAAGDPGNAQAARDVSGSLNNIGRVAMRAGDLAAARDAYTEMHETLRRLAAGDPGNAQAARDVSVSLDNIGEVAMRAGDLAAARDAYIESLDIARGLAAGDPGNAQAARDVSVSLDNIGEVAMAAGDLAAARDAYIESLDIARGLAAGDPGNAQAARDVSVSLNNIGEVAMAAGDLAAARDAYIESLDIARGLAAGDPGNAQAARDVSVSLNNIGEVAMRAGDLAAARDAYIESLDTRRGLAAGDPGNAQAARDVSVSLDNIGEVAMRAGDLAAARDAYIESLDTRRGLAAGDPGNAQAARDVSVSLNNIGEVAMRAGDLAAARDAYIESLDTRRRLAAGDPGNAQAARDVSGSLNNIGRVAMRAGDLAAARDAYTEMHETLRRLTAGDPGNAQAARDVSVSLDNIGEVAMRAGDLAAARDAYIESLDIARGLAAGDPGNAQAARDVSVSLDNIGEVAMRAGDLAAARDAYIESLDTRRRLAAGDPGNAQAARDVSVSLNNIGEVAMRAGDLAAARDAYIESLDTRRRLAAGDPGNAQAARDVSGSLNNIGLVAMRAGDLAAARDAYTEMHETLRRLTAGDPGNAQAARDVLVSLWRMAQLAEKSDGDDGSQSARAAWSQVAEHFEAMAARRLLLPADEKLGAHIRAKAAGRG